jgi:hypothetical protein
MEQILLLQAKKFRARSAFSGALIAQVTT